MSEKSSNSSGSDEDVDPESGQPVELGGVLSKVRQTMYLYSGLDPLKNTATTTITKYLLAFIQSLMCPLYTSLWCTMVGSN